MSALFDYRTGAFPGAVADRPGLLRSADTGMLFDEIGASGLDEQAMILRAIEDKRLPVGADKDVKSDFQLIAGTNRDLGEAAGGLRDLAAGVTRMGTLSRRGVSIWSASRPRLRGCADCGRGKSGTPRLGHRASRSSGRHGA